MNDYEIEMMMAAHNARVLNKIFETLNKPKQLPPKDECQHDDGTDHGICNTCGEQLEDYSYEHDLEDGR